MYSEIYSSVENYLEDFNTLWQQVFEITGVKCEIFRFAGGSINGYNGQIYQEIIAEMTRRGFVYYDWNVSSGDAGTGTNSVSSIIANGTSPKHHERAIILMHDSYYKTTTALALPQIIDFYEANGYSVKPLTNEVKPVIFSYK